MSKLPQNTYNSNLQYIINTNVVAQNRPLKEGRNTLNIHYICVLRGYGEATEPTLVAAATP